MDSYECLEALAKRVDDELVVTNLGGVAREWFYLNDRDGNLYRPYMGHPTPLALGVALALPERRVIAIDGDGSMLMGLTVLPVLGNQNPSNLVVIVIDNETYEATGGPASLTAGGTDLSAMARAAGVTNTWLVRDIAAFEAAVDEAYRAEGASFITAKVEASKRRVPYADLEGPENKYRFVRYIERTEGLQIIKKPKKALPQDIVDKTG
ncbi:MAG: thiamine pyrophosphate-dependent enzyme [Alphaproteobacteria bacterium]|nr:thiamine pyrophosphate-dependent enzyme [Alphaproteobacteria bacterium]